MPVACRGRAAALVLSWVGETQYRHLNPERTDAAAPSTPRPRRIPPPHQGCLFLVPQILEAANHQRGPAGLMIGTEPATGFAVKIFVE